jgi:hypothetical protein
MLGFHPTVGGFCVNDSGPTGPRMIQTSLALPQSPTARLKIAGAFACLLALPALGPLTAVEKASLPVPALSPRIATESPPAPLHSYTYYPEQLAALQSLSGFQPTAEAGAGPAAPAALANPAALVVKPLAGEAKSPRRVEPMAKLALTAPAPTVVTEIKTEAKLFGLSLPYSLDVGGRVAGLRDMAAHWGEAALGWGGGLAKFWR